MTRRYTGSSKVPESRVCNPEALGDPQTRDKASAIVTLTAYPQARGQGMAPAGISAGRPCAVEVQVCERGQRSEKGESKLRKQSWLCEKAGVTKPALPVTSLGVRPRSAGTTPPASGEQAGCKPQQHQTCRNLTRDQKLGISLKP